MVSIVDSKPNQSLILSTPVLTIYLHNYLLYELPCAYSESRILCQSQVELEVTLTKGMATWNLFKKDDDAFWIHLFTKGLDIDKRELNIKLIAGHHFLRNCVVKNIAQMRLRSGVMCSPKTD